MPEVQKKSSPPMTLKIVTHDWAVEENFLGDASTRKKKAEKKKIRTKIWTIHQREGSAPRSEWGKVQG